MVTSMDAELYFSISCTELKLYINTVNNGRSKKLLIQIFLYDFCFFMTVNRFLISEKLIEFANTGVVVLDENNNNKF